MIKFLKGKKTYIIAVLMLILGYLTVDNGMMLEGLAIMTLRAGIAKNSPTKNADTPAQ